MTTVNQERHRKGGHFPYSLFTCSLMAAASDGWSVCFVTGGCGRRSLPAVHNDLMLPVVGFNPTQGSTESTRAENRKYQCKHEVEISVWKGFYMPCSEPKKKKKLWDFQLQWEHYQILLYCSFPEPVQLPKWKPDIKYQCTAPVNSVLNHYLFLWSFRHVALLCY